MSSETKDLRKRPWVVVGVACLSLMLFITLMGLTHRSFKTTLSNGGTIRVTPASFWATWLSEARCKIIYQPKDREAGAISLLQDTDSRLAMVMPAADGKSLLCLYYADVCFRLFRIDPTKKPGPFPQGNYLKYIVKESSWDIKPGTTNDWYEVLNHLKTAPPDIFDQEAGTTYDLGVCRLHFGRKDLSDAVETQIQNMRWGFSY